MELSGDFFVEQIDFLQEIVVKLSVKNLPILDNIHRTLKNFVPSLYDGGFSWTLYSKYRYSQEDGNDFIEWGKVVFEVYPGLDGKVYKNLTFTPALGNTYCVGNYSKKIEHLPPPPTGKTSSNIYDEVKMGSILSSLLQQLQAIMKDPEPYNQWIKAELPHSFREGKILHRELSKHYKNLNYSIYRLLILDRVKKNEVTYFPEMTLGIYGSLWGTAYLTLIQKSDGKQASPLEVFYISNFRFTHPEMREGVSSFELWNSPKYFHTWLKEGSHQLDLIYSRLSLVPEKDQNGWRIRLLCNREWYMGDAFRFYRVLTDAFNIGLDIEKEMYIDMLEEIDYVRITSDPNKRSCYEPKEKIYIGIPLYVFDDSERSNIINKTEWDNIEDYYLKLK